MTWWVDFYRDSDSMDLSRAAKWFGDDIEMRFGNNATVKGKAAVIGAFEHFQEQLSGLRHDLGAVVSSGDETFVESRVTYTFKDGRDRSFPAVTYIQRRDGLIRAMRIYVDVHSENQEP